MLNLALLVDLLFAILAVSLLRNIFFATIPLIIPFAICATAVSILLLFYITNTTEIANVWLNSHSNTPLIYKIAGLWGNHEGSMLLFFTCLTAWGALLLRETDAIRLASLVLLALGLYLYFQANPFTILSIKATAGQDLNPALQNPYLTIHPPILYLGQSLCLVLWAWACVAPDHSQLSSYTRLCFGLITLGLILGARWAYGELGWGGFWFWDPVETVSLFPWLAIIAAVHAGPANRTCLILSFPMVMLGLALVRSGVLVSVHSFGFDLHSGVWLGLCTTLVWIISAAVLCKGKTPRVCAISFGFLAFLGLLVTLILLPIIANYCFGVNATLDEGFFHRFINPLALVLFIFAGFAPYLKIKNHGWSLICASLATTLWCWLMQPDLQWLAIFTAMVAFWLIFSTTVFLKDFFSRGFVAAHLGVALCILGASHAEIFTLQTEINLANLPVKFGKYTVNYQAQAIVETPQFSREILFCKVNGLELTPERQHFHTSKTIKHQPAWLRVNLDHIHATAFASSPHEWKVELMLKPLISLFWFGLLLVLFGIFVSTKTYCKKSPQLNC